MGYFRFHRAVPALLAAWTSLSLPASGQDAAGYTHCSFYPQGPACTPIYQQALRDSSPAARSVRDAFTFYARYLRTSASLTDQDRAWLGANQITLPDLTAENLGGLHNVIADPALDAQSRRDAVNNYINRALEAEIYCGVNAGACGTDRPQAG